MSQIRHSPTPPVTRLPGASSLQLRLIAALLLAAIGIAVYYNGFRAPLVFDGKKFILENPSVRKLWPLEFSLGPNRPFGFLTFTLNYAWGGYDVWGYHAVNLAIHVAAAWLLFDIVRRTLARGRLADRFAAHAWGLALTIAVVWLAHPLQTNAVTYIYQRLESLMGLFYLATLWCLLRSLDSPRGGWFQAASVVCCALGMATKEVMVTAPVMVLWYDRVFAAGSWRELFDKRGKYYAALAATWGILAWLMLTHTDGYEVSGVLVIKGVSPLGYALSQPGIILHYLRLAFWPDGLCLDYGWPVATHAIDIIPAALVIGALLALTAWAAWRWPELGFLGGWFFLILAPTSSVAPLRDLAFEHRMYLPLAAVVSLVVLGGFAAWRRLGDFFGSERPAAGFLLAAIPAGVAVAVAVALGYFTVLRNRDYNSDLSIWEDNLRKSPQNARSHNGLGVALLAQNRPAEAVRRFQEALSIQPSEDVYCNLGGAQRALGKPDAAVDAYARAAQLQPNMAEAYRGRAGAYEDQRNWQKALADYDRAIELDAQSGDAFQGRANVLMQLHQPEAALRDLKDALRLKPGSAEIYNNLGVVYGRLGNLDEALRCLSKAVELNSSFPDAYFNRARTYARLAETDSSLAPLAVNDLSIGSRLAIYKETAAKLRADTAKTFFIRAEGLIRRHDYQHARVFLDCAIALEPGAAMALNARGWLLATCPDNSVRDGRQAVGDATKACELTSWKAPEFMDTLAAAYAESGDFQEALRWCTEALKLAAGKKELTHELEAHVQLYRAGKPLRDEPPGEPPAAGPEKGKS